MRPLGKLKFLTDIVKGCERFMITVFDYYISNSHFGYFTSGGVQSYIFYDNRNHIFSLYLLIIICVINRGVQSLRKTVYERSCTPHFVHRKVHNSVNRFNAYIQDKEDSQVQKNLAKCNFYSMCEIFKQIQWSLQCLQVPSKAKLISCTNSHVGVGFTSSSGNLKVEAYLFSVGACNNDNLNCSSYAISNTSST